MEQIPLFKVYMSKKAAGEVQKVLDSGYIGQGPKVDEFEKQLSERFNNDLTLTVNSATSAEHLALHLLKEPARNQQTLFGAAQSSKAWPGMQPGDEILATPMTCTATNWPILANGFNIKWVDVDPKTANMDLDDLARKITHRTKAIMLVHWGGTPVDLDKLAQIQKDAEAIYGFKPAVIEDSAHAFGSYYDKKPIGSHGNINTFSFQAIKHLTAVDGGALVLPHQELYSRAKLLRWYGIDRNTNKKDFRCELDIPEWGFKFHMNDVNAAIGMANLAEVQEQVIDKHKANAHFYNGALVHLDGVTLLEAPEKADSAYWIYSMLVEDKAGFMRKMKEKNIIVSQVHERNDIHSCVSQYKSMLPNLDKLTSELISIPAGWWVTEEQRNYILGAIEEGW